ncbi:MAG: ArnT family glycosyltransferase [Kiritimatiellia bacterium]
MKYWEILLIAALLWIPTALVNPPTRQQELRVLISARNMLESGNFHRPEFQNQPRFRKPPMAYWLAAAGMGLTGNHQAAWAGRLLFVLSAMGGILLLIRIAGPAGFHAALVALFSFGFWRYAPMAETDMIQIVGILLFFYAWQRQAGLLAGLGISFACLSKGPGGFLIPILSLIVLLRFYRPQKKFILTALLLPLFLIGGWILYLIGQNSGLEQMQKDLNATFVDSAHRNPWYYYFYTLPLLMIPSGFLLFLRPGKKEQSASLERKTAWAWLLVTLVLLMLTVSKQRHYALLLLPAAAWLIGMRLQSRRIPALGIFLGLAATLSLGSVLHTLQSEDYLNADFLAQTRPRVRKAPTLHVVGINSAIFDFHLGRHVENTDDPLVAWNRAAPGDAVIVLAPRDSWQEPRLPPAAAEIERDDEFWIRRCYLKQEPKRNLDSPALTGK